MINAKEMNQKTFEVVKKIEQPKRDASINFCEDVLTKRIEEASNLGIYFIHVAEIPERATLNYIKEYMENFGYIIKPWRNRSFFVYWK